MARRTGSLIDSRAAQAANIIKILHPLAELETCRPGSLKIAYSGDRPTDYLEGGELRGLHGEVRRLVAELLGLEVDLVHMHWPDMLDALGRGEIDLPGMGTAWTSARASRYGYSQPFHYFFFGLAHRGADSSAVSLSKFRGKRVAAIDASANNPELLHCFGSDSVRFFSTLTEVVDDLVNGHSDVAIYDLPNIDIALKARGGEQEFSTSPLMFEAKYPLTTGRSPNYLVFRGDAHRLQAATDLVLDALKSTGTLERVFAKYGFGDDRMHMIITDI